MKKCKKCGYNMNDADIFCQKCGEICNSKESGFKCPKCGCTCDEVENFCRECGAVLKKSEFAENSAFDSFASDNHDMGYLTSDKTYTDASDFRYSGNSEKHSGIFVENDEYTVSTLGSGFFQNMISGGGISAVNGVLSQKRLYLSGKSYERSGRSWRKTKISKIIEVDEITGSGYASTSNVGALIFTIISVVAIFILSLVFRNYYYWVIPCFTAVISLVAYILSRHTIFIVEYAGGSIGFDVKWLNSSNTANFQRQIHLIKGKRKRGNE